MDEFFKIVSQMETETALAEIAQVLKRLLSDLDSDRRQSWNFPTRGNISAVQA